jgi:hypothetical protein
MILKHKQTATNQKGKYQNLKDKTHFLYDE